MPEPGHRASQILERLAMGSHSLQALIAAVDPDHPEAVLHALTRLERSGAVTVTGRTRARRLTGATVALAVQPPRPA